VNDIAESARRAEANAFNGTRKLIRPRLPVEKRRHDPSHTEDPLSHAMQEFRPSIESTHAEAFYFQKQIQQQTDMTVVLEDGEQMHGLLEWYDRCVIKLRCGRKRVLIYKAGIKYLYKSSEALPPGIMK
jgi:sRNA-binding regulator protein Hfq